MNIKPPAVRTLEFFAGIGGLKAACPWLDVQAAMDIDRDAKCVYTSNFAGNYICCELATIRANQLADYQADLWWLSPPCTPFTQKGKRKDNADLRTEALGNLIQLASQLRPQFLVIENVLGFELSETCNQTLRILEQSGYGTRICKRCPTQIGWPNRRRRVYLLAWKNPISEKLYQHILKSWSEDSYPTSSPTLPRRLQEFLDPTITRQRNPELWLDHQTTERYHQSIDRVNPGDANATTACFGSSYGKALNRSGSYLWQDEGYRLFSPREVANLLGFPSRFVLPDHLPDRRLWHLLGNSLSLPSVRELMLVTLTND
ncbi:MAG: DNA cytosine methyltransferase [Planctomycetota bacterium]